jgi:hypothetical protein
MLGWRRVQERLIGSSRWLTSSALSEMAGAEVRSGGEKTIGPVGGVRGMLLVATRRVQTSGIHNLGLVHDDVARVV